MKTSLIAVMAVCLLASGCAKKVKPDNLPALSGTITGSVAYRERIALPPDAKLIVSLEDVSRADSSATFVAQQTLQPKGQVPIAFTLRYLPSAIDRSHRYAVRAVILDSQDALMWTSTETYSISFNEAEKPLAIMLHHVVNPNIVAAPPVNAGFAYKCKDLEFIAKFETDKVQILLPGRTLMLPQVISGSGARYSDGSVTFWSKGDNALFEMNGIDYQDCKVDTQPASAR